MFTARFSGLTGLLAFVLITLVPKATAADAVQIVSHIRRETIYSSALASAGYSKRRHILEIEFWNGAIYRYLDVPLSVYRELMSADSKARYYDANIKGNYRSLRLRAATPTRQVD